MFIWTQVDCLSREKLFYEFVVKWETNSLTINLCVCAPMSMGGWMFVRMHGIFEFLYALLQEWQITATFPLRILLIV